MSLKIVHHFPLLQISEHCNYKMSVISWGITLFTNNSVRNSIQFNSIHIYLRANLTAQRPITKLARVRTESDHNAFYAVLWS
jgi:hypothetical protein